MTTLSDIADLAGVSAATVSRVLNGSTRKPGEAIATRVRDAAEQLSYVPNAQAQGLAKATSGLAGLIVHDIADPYFAEIARGVQRAEEEQQKMVLLATTDGTPDSEREAVASFAAHRTESIVIAGSRSSRPQHQAANALLAAELDRYCHNGGRVGVIGHPIIGATAVDGYHVVPVPNEELAAKLATRLANVRRAGKFIIIGGPDGRLASEDRIRGFQRGLADAGITAAQVVNTSFDRDGGYSVGLNLARGMKSPAHREPEPALCVFAANDVMALGIATAFASEGIRITQDAIISGFDGTELLRGLAPALPTVQLPLERIGYLAATGKTSDGSDMTIRGEVVLSPELLTDRSSISYSYGTISQ